MVRRPRVDYTAVREMAISEIAELWHEELNMPRGLLERELRISVLNLAQNWRREGLIDPIPPDDELPPVTTRLQQWQVLMFCRKQKGWPLPSFWFPPEPKEVRRPGRPSHMDAIVQELDRRAEAEELEDTVTKEARVLNNWAIEEGYRRLKDKSIRNKISARFKELKEGH